MTAVTIFTDQAWASTDDSPVNVGNVFSVDSDSVSHRCRYRKADAGNDGRPIAAAVWDAAGTLIGSGSRLQTAADAAGWVWIDWSASVDLGAGQTYLVSYFDPVGHYSYIIGPPAISTPPLHTPLQPGRYSYGMALLLPTNVSGAAFGIDIEAEVTEQPGAADLVLHATLAAQSHRLRAAVPGRQHRLTARPAPVRRLRATLREQP